ncbi:uncharacterized protein LOC112196680 isoform X2 [Rosa chinensis]|uniref:uncharacterized protein LOC112196680 isoform X2 n=1 Tax=Rosa chinensis TaxID=74649 RepID=UPI000D08E096|nr:uncharacterized protein LOC112196680 isoform X2 [Rosa chinensis]
MAQMMSHEELPMGKGIFFYDDPSQLEEAQLRLHRLKTKFHKVFGHLPQVYARSPVSFLWYFLYNKSENWGRKKYKADYEGIGWNRVEDRKGV